MARGDLVGSGARRYRVTVQRRSRTSDGAGGSTGPWTNLRTVWAEIRPLSGNQRLQAEQLQSTVKHRAYMRFIASDDNAEMPFCFAGDRLLYKGIAYNILAVIDVEERRRWLELDLESGVAA